MLCGGASPSQPANEEIQKICEEVKAACESMGGTSLAKFIAVTYKTQVVAGTNYFISVDIGDGKFIHLRVFKALPHANQKLELAKILTGKTADDPLEYF